MKKMLFVPVMLALASCAPQIQQAPEFTSSRAYAGNCPEALSELTATALRTQPAVLFGGNTWPPLSVVDRSENVVTYRSINGTGGSTSTVNVRATCVQNTGNAEVTLTSSGQRQSFINALNDALLAGINLPHP